MEPRVAAAAASEAPVPALLTALGQGLEQGRAKGCSCCAPCSGTRIALLCSGWWPLRVGQQGSVQQMFGTEPPAESAPPRKSPPLAAMQHASNEALLMLILIPLVFLHPPSPSQGHRTYPDANLVPEHAGHRHFSTRGPRFPDRAVCSGGVCAGGRS